MRSLHKVKIACSACDLSTVFIKMFCQKRFLKIFFSFYSIFVHFSPSPSLRHPTSSSSSLLTLAILSLFHSLPLTGCQAPDTERPLRDEGTIVDTSPPPFEWHQTRVPPSSCSSTHQLVPLFQLGEWVTILCLPVLDCCCALLFFWIWDWIAP